jgi:preprotein translocase subunit SecD
VLLKRDVIATGEQLIDASFAPSQGEPAVSVKLNSRGGDEMLRTTRENLNRPMAVVFIEKERELVQRDGQEVAVDRSKEEVISVATIRGVFSNNFQITGLSAAEGTELAKLLRAGALAAPIIIVEQRVIGRASARTTSRRHARPRDRRPVPVRVHGDVLQGVRPDRRHRAADERGPDGRDARALQRRADAAGIAGIVLTVGTAVDANILIYERIREELKVGASPWAAINAGFDKAFSAIADSNVTMVMSAGVLFLFGSGPVRGFAVTLFIGVVASMFTALVGSRALIYLIYGRQRRVERLAI